MHIDFIVDWIAPSENEVSYNFMIAKAHLVFETVDAGDVQLTWSNPLECIIDDIQKLEGRTLPNGGQQWRWRVEFFTPDADIELWASGYRLDLLEAPKLTDRQSLS